MEATMRLLMMCVIPVVMLGCDGGDVSCTTDIRYSVSVTVEDEAGDPITGASVEYSVDGGESVACEEGASGNYSCGEEVEGSILVFASADGFGTDEATVTVEADECHVIGQAVTLTLPIED
jgi:hypothetical protein